MKLSVTKEKKNINLNCCMRYVIFTHRHTIPQKTILILIIFFHFVAVLVCVVASQFVFVVNFLPQENTLKCERYKNKIKIIEKRSFLPTNYTSGVM